MTSAGCLLPLALLITCPSRCLAPSLNALTHPGPADAPLSLCLQPPWPYTSVVHFALTLLLLAPSHAWRLPMTPSPAVLHLHASLALTPLLIPPFHAHYITGGHGGCQGSGTCWQVSVEGLRTMKWGKGQVKGG